MKNILNKLLEKWLCKHDWGLFQHIKGYWGDKDDIISHQYILVCKKCGKIKKIKV